MPEQLNLYRKEEKRYNQEKIIIDNLLSCDPFISQVLSTEHQEKLIFANDGKGLIDKLSSQDLNSLTKKIQQLASLTKKIKKDTSNNQISLEILPNNQTAIISQIASLATEINNIVKYPLAIHPKIILTFLNEYNQLQSFLTTDILGFDYNIVERVKLEITLKLSNLLKQNIDNLEDFLLQFTTKLKNINSIINPSKSSSSDKNLLSQNKKQQKQLLLARKISDLFNIIFH